MSGQGYNFHGKKAKFLRANLEEYKRQRERAMWTPDLVADLCEFVADGPTDAAAFERAALALGFSEDACRRRFAIVANQQEAPDWRPTDE